MDIIARDGEIVNIISSEIPREITGIVSEIGEKWTMHKLSAKNVADKLMKIQKYARGYRMQTCAEKIGMAVCQKCGRKHITYAQLCRDRFCPVCGWRLALKRFANMVQIVQGLRERYPESEWQFVTLTVANCRPEELGVTLDEMARTWNCIWSRKSTKTRPIQGWARSLEVTYNKDTKTFHPHYHVLVLWDDGYSPDEFEQEWLERAWMKTIQLRTVSQAQKSEMVSAQNRCMISSIYDQEEEEAQEVTKAVLETYKYSIKSKDLQEMPLKIFKELDEKLKGRRMVAFGGIVKEYAQEMGLVNMDKAAETADEDDDDQRACMACGSTQVIEIVGQWAGDGYIWRRDT